MLTSRLSLARPVEGDTDAILRIHRDPLACEHNPSDMIGSWQQALDRCRQWRLHWVRHGFGYYVVRRRDSEQVVGFCGLKIVRFHEETVLNLFYRLDPAAWGHGYGGEAAAAVMAGAPAEYPVIARVRPANVASARIAARVGLVRASHLDTMGDDGLDWIFASANL